MNVVQKGIELLLLGERNIRRSVGQRLAGNKVARHLHDVVVTKGSLDGGGIELQPAEGVIAGLIELQGRQRLRTHGFGCYLYRLIDRVLTRQAGRDWQIG